VVGKFDEKGAAGLALYNTPLLSNEGIHLGGTNITLFILTRMIDALVGNRNKMRFSSRSIGSCTAYLRKEDSVIVNQNPFTLA
jgi:hypothetical protein